MGYFKSFSELFESNSESYQQHLDTSSLHFPYIFNDLQSLIKYFRDNDVYVSISVDGSSNSGQDDMAIAKAFDERKKLQKTEKERSFSIRRDDFSTARSLRLVKIRFEDQRNFQDL